ncbi:MAG: hypothetical protein J7L88_03050, partial [Thermoplasmata archaeon]|nr:hypothetical protein [Thermoplasmata archaeon]
FEDVTNPNPPGGYGEIRVRYKYEGEDPTYFTATGTYTIRIKMESAGDYRPRVGVIGFVDDGNDFTLIYDYTYYAIEG